MKQFREYNKIPVDILAEALGISAADYTLMESGKQEPDIDVINSLALFYKVTIDEFYGYTPRLTLHSESDFDDDEVDRSTLHMADLSWEEMRLVLHFRKKGADDEIIQAILKADFDDEK